MSDLVSLASLMTPGDLLTLLESRLSARKLRLFACAVARTGPLPDAAFHNSIAVGERYADGRAKEIDISVAWGRANAANRPIAGEFVHTRWTVMAVTASAHSRNLLPAIRQWTVFDDVPVLLDLVADPALLFSTPDRFPPWRTAEALEIAGEAYEKRCPDTGRLDHGLLSILADCLEDRGCVSKIVCPRCRGKDYYEEGDRMSNMYPETCPRCGRHPHSDNGGYVHAPHPMLAHLRDKRPHYRGCWALDLVLGKE
jgi:hypothetical protein